MTPKPFTEADLDDHNGYKCLYADRDDLLYDPQETASGYGSRLNTGLKIHFCGRLYRLYTTVYSNAGTTWFEDKGQKIFIL